MTYLLWLLMLIKHGGCLNLVEESQKFVDGSLQALVEHNLRVHFTGCTPDNIIIVL